MYEREEPESSTELSSSGPSAERASETSSSMLLWFFSFLLSVGRGLLLLPCLPTERHAPLLLPFLVPASSLSSSPLFERESGRL